MRKLILAMHISLDGYVCGPNGELDWVIRNKDIDVDLPALIENADTLLIGRKLYEGFYSYWPNALAMNNGLSEGEKSFAQWVQTAKKVVFSKTLEKAPWENSIIVSDNIVEEVNNLKQQSGKDMIMFGGASIAQAFAGLNLIDQYSLMINPIILGNGISLFKASEGTVKLKLNRSKSYESGVVSVIYDTIRD